MDSPIETGRFHFLSSFQRDYNGKIIQAMRQGKVATFSQSEIAFLMQITPQRVSNIVRDSLEKMRDLVRKDLTIDLA